MTLLYRCMLDKDMPLIHITTKDPEYFLLIDFCDMANTSIGFYEKGGKIGITSYVRVRGLL